MTIDEIHGLTKLVDLIKLAKEFPGTGTGQKGKNGDGKASKFRCALCYTGAVRKSL